MEFQVGQTVICEIDVYGNGDGAEFDGYILFVNEDSVDVSYLEGYHSRNDRVKFENIVALVDHTRTVPHYRTKAFSGHLIPNPTFKPMLLRTQH